MVKWMLGLVAALALHGAALADDWKKVVSPAELKALGTDVTVLDIRGDKAFAKGHIAGALSAPYGSWRGPAQNPGMVLSDDALTKRLQSLGIKPEDRVVITYAGANATDFGAAARVYWTLKSAGLTEIAILNGGLKGWVAAKLPLTTRARKVVPSRATYALSDAWMIDRAGVQAVLDGERSAVMIDARPPDFWSGKLRHKAAPRAGTLKGALNLTHETWFGGKKTEIVSGEQVLQVAKEAGFVRGQTELVSFCNTGHWAATNWFALSELAGIEGVKLYPESMVGWTTGGGGVVNGG